MQQLPKALQDKIAQREEANSLRKLSMPNSLVDFSSNDYLGFSRSAEIAEEAHQILQQKGIAGNGATGSRLISGNHKLYADAEDIIANFHSIESALIFNSGYDANVGLFSSVPQKGDVVLYDEYIHASIRDGLRLSNASAYKFPHNDLNALQTLLKRFRERSATKEIYVATESVFSMDGDSPNLTDMVNLCEEYNALLIVDEAHALGVTGHGRGMVQEQGLNDKVFAQVMTFGKALGCHGAAVLGSAQLKQYLINFARSFIYTTGLPPHSVATILAAYSHLQNEVEAKNKLKSNIHFFKNEIKRLCLDCFVDSDSAIHCAIVPGNETVKTIAATLQGQGYDVKAILSPTVPEGQERLRFCLHSYNTAEEITGVLMHLQQLLHP
jgi:8-amino-7-oxononanoate synthase